VKTIDIKGRKIGPGHEPFIIAEMSGNHNQSLERALAIVDAAAKAGVHALKIQTYTADTMTINLAGGEFRINDRGSLWKGETLYGLYKKAYTPWKWHKTIFDRCRKHGIIGFSTPFDSSAVDFLESLNVPLYKVASFENTDLPLVKKIAATGKPMIISTGLATGAELDETVRVTRRFGCKDLVLLKCTSDYPADPTDSNLLTIPHMKDLFQCQIGLSDHTLGVGVSLAAVALGATVIERHVTLSRKDKGVDSAFSLEPQELELLVKESKKAWRSLGGIFYGPTAVEKKNLRFRRSLYIVEDMKAGDIFTRRTLRNIRPGFGLPPKFIDAFIGKRAGRAIKRGTPATWGMLA
jgi:pseudaminic acid synthase